MTQASARSRRDAPTPLQDLEKNTLAIQKTFTDQLNALVNSKNTEEVNKALKDASDSVLRQLSAFSSSLQSAVSTVHLASPRLTAYLPPLR